MSRGELNEALDAARGDLALSEGRCRDLEAERDALLQQVRRRKRQAVCLAYDLTMARKGGER